MKNPLDNEGANVKLAAMAAAGLLLGFLLAEMPRMFRPAPPPMMNRTENMTQRFLIEMIPHHEVAVQMAEDAVSKAEHPELKDLARRIKESQAAEIELMKGWLAAWYGGEWRDGPPPMMGAGMHSFWGPPVPISRIGEMESFDENFIELMIPHHEMALRMAQMARMSERSEVRNLAEEIIRTQTAEIRQMEEWYENWYGRK